MVQYVINSQTSQGAQTSFGVMLKADNGYSENQIYVGDLNTLRTAQDHFNTTVMARERVKMTLPGDHPSPLDIALLNT